MLTLPSSSKVSLMQRRTFLNVATTATAAMALDPLVFAGSPETKAPVRYPDPSVEVVDPRFAQYVVGNAAVERLYTGCRWAEGPVWFGDGRYLLWSDIPNNRVLRWLEDTGEVSSSATRRTTATATPAIARDTSSPASTIPAASPAPNTTARSPCWLTATRASRSTRRTTSRFTPTAQCGSPIRASES